MTKRKSNSAEKKQTIIWFLIFSHDEELKILLQIVSG